MIQLVNHFSIHGIGMTKIEHSEKTTARQRMAKPPPLKAKRGEPSIRTQIQRKKYLNAHAQPMIVTNETAAKRLQPM